MAKKHDLLPTDNQAWIERIQSIDYGDHKKAAVTLGAAAAVGLGLGTYMLSKKHGSKQIKIGYADRHYEQTGVISAVETGREGRFAVGVPTSEAETGSGMVFSMDEDTIARPDLDARKIPDFVDHIKKFGGYLLDIFQSRASIPEATEPEGSNVARQ